MMKPILEAKKTIYIGEAIVIETDTPDNRFGVVFEDEGETGYFYARDYSVPDQLFVDAIYINSVAEVTDKNIPSEVQILWTQDYSKSVLIINQYPHALFDFESKIGYSRDQFPEPDPTTGWKHKP